MMQKDDYQIELDIPLYKKLLNIDFVEKDGMIFLKDYINSLEAKVADLMGQKKSKTEIEQYLNHIHMGALSTFYGKQKNIALSIIENWKSKLKKEFPKKEIVTELVDEGGEYVIYLYAKR